MNNPSRSTTVCEGGGPRLPNGRQVGTYSEEDSKLVWTRRIKTKHVLCLLDALTINEGLLRRIREDGVKWIRYKLRGVGAYETALARFVQKCSLLRRFADGENVYALPRSEWDFTPDGDEAFALFQMDGDGVRRN